jgi:hypothetical protein
LLGIVRAVFFGSESRGTHEYILLSLLFIFPQPGGPISYIYSLQEKVSPVKPRALGSITYILSLLVFVMAM